MRAAIVALILASLLAACSAAPAPAPTPAPAPVVASTTASAPAAPKVDEVRAAIDDVRTRIERGESASDVNSAILHARAALEARDGLGDSREAQELAGLEFRRTLEDLRSAKRRADEIQARDPSDFAAITRAYIAAEESIDDRAVRLIKSGVPGASEAKELLVEVRDRANGAAELWADSPTLGLARVAPRDLLDPREFVAQPGQERAHWLASPLAHSSIDGGALVAEGLVKSASPNTKSIRAGILFWAPDAKTPIRDYELTLQFTVVHKGFTLLARKGAGFMNHSYGFEAKEASTETRRALSSITDPCCFAVIEGKSYEIVERVVGKRVQIRVKPLDGGDEAEPIEDSTNARSGGIGIQLLPNAVVRFERASIKILQ